MVKPRHRKLDSYLRGGRYTIVHGLFVLILLFSDNQNNTNNNIENDSRS